MNSKADIHTRGANDAKKLRRDLERLNSNFAKGTARRNLKRRARVLDAFFHESYERSECGPKLTLSGHPYAIVAQGGYGREEQCVCSDVDLLILFEDKMPDLAEELVREVVYPLWDAGLDVGYATRSITECIELANENIEALTALLDGRFLCGMSPLYTAVMEDVRNKILGKQADAIIASLVKTNMERHEVFGDSAYLLEPNLKEGQGGLRDYHTILWIARIKSGITRLKDLEHTGYMTHKELISLKEALGFIWDVRNRLHHTIGRKYDRLHFDKQIGIADALGFENKNGQQAVERFLGMLHEHMEFIKQQYLMFIYEQRALPAPGPRRRRKPGIRFEKLKIERDRLHFTSSRAIIRNPALLIHIFEESARLKTPLCSRANRLVKEFCYLVDEEFRTSAGAVKSLERILLAPAHTFNALNEMLHTGLLVQLIPEFKRIVNRIQYDEYHLYPVDRHLLNTVQALKRFAARDETTETPFCYDIYNELPDKRPLFWAALLHDIGKGEPGKGQHAHKGADIARDVLLTRGYRRETAETVAFLIREHLLLIKTATRRDINDEKTAMECARRIADVQRLKMLYLLTVADSLATGPKAWNSWTGTLLRSLYLKVRKILETGELATREAVKINEAKRAIIVNSAGPESLKEREALFDIMAPRYLLYTPVADILEHMELYQEMGDADFTWDVQASPSPGSRTVTMFARDKPGLFSKMAGTFTLNSIDILDAQIYTWRNNMALDIFTVKPPPDHIMEQERWARARGNFAAVLSGELDLASALEEKLSRYRKLKPKTSGKPHKVVVNNEDSSFFTIIDVHTYDFPGLLYTITNALFQCELDVRVAKIATKVDQVVDVFYVCDIYAAKVDEPDRVAEIKEAVLDALPEIEV
ncbi:MAG: [protein-PII] uridylyltransferase [Desulfobacterales bacterium]|nr:[protein-PII] uridylyltransferase [Desulfobacterales bacterium]